MNPLFVFGIPLPLRGCLTGCIVPILSLAVISCQGSTGSTGTDGKATATGPAAVDPAQGDAAKGDAAKADASKGDAAKPDAAKPDAAKPDAAKPGAGANKQAPKPKLDEAKALHRQLLALLNEGRALTKAGDYVGGMAKYREALAIDASDPTVLGELGWAAYKAGDLVLADQTTTTALAFQRDEKRRGMLLYNLGRIEEDRKHTEAAIEHYRASLIARPGNATVQGRLDALLAGAPPPAAGDVAPPVVAEGPAPYTPLASLGRDLADLDAVCKLVIEQRCENFMMGDDDSCACDPGLLATPGADQSWGLLRFANQDMPSQVGWFPVVQTDEGWTVFDMVLSEYNPGAFGIFEETQIGQSTVEPLLAAGTQLVMRLNKTRMDRDMGLNEIEDEASDALVICSRDERGAHCTQPLLSSYHYRREVEFEDFEEEGGPEIDHEGLPVDDGFKATLAFADGQLVVTWTETRGGYDRLGDNMFGGWVLAAGSYALTELLG